MGTALPPVAERGCSTTGVETMAGVDEVDEDLGLMGTGGGRPDIFFRWDRGKGGER